MYKLTYTTKDELFGYETDNAWFNLHAIDNEKDICGLRKNLINTL